MKLSRKMKFFDGLTLTLVMLSAIRCLPGHPDMPSNELVIGMSTAPKSMDPRYGSDVSSARIHQLLYNSLVALDSQARIIPELADSWEDVSDTICRFHIRKDVFFHNGKRLTANDVGATFRSIIDPQFKSPKRGAYDPLKSIRVLDDFTIEFETGEPYASFMILMVMGILPAEIASSPDQASFQPIGTGPFQFESRSGDDWITLQANKNYFKRTPSLNRIHMKTIPDDSVRLWELERGDIDFLQNNIPPDSMDWITGEPDLKVMSSPGSSFYYLGINLRKESPLQDVRVRKSLMLGTDRESIIKYLLDGQAVPAESVLPETHWAYDGSLGKTPYDPMLAGRLLDEAGYRKDQSGFRFKVEFKSSQNKVSLRIAEAVQAQWAKIGVRMSIKSLEFGTFYDDILKGNFEVYFLSWVGISDPDIYYSLFHSKSIPLAGRNRGYYHSSDIDRLVEEARREFDTDRRISLYREIQQILHSDLPYINLWHTNNVAVLKSELSGYELYPSGDFSSMDQIFWGSDSK